MKPRYEECIICNAKVEYYHAKFAALPPAGILTEKHYICSDCIKTSFMQRINLLTVFSIYKKYYDTAINELFGLAKHYLPQIFKLQRKNINKQLREQILKKYGYKCVKCNSKEELTIDHIKPYSKGGDENLNNLQPLCKSCNSVKGIKTIDYRND